MRRKVALLTGALSASIALIAAPASALPPGNLLANPSAEAGPGSTDAYCGGDLAPPGWSRTGALTVVRFGIGGFPPVGSGDGSQLFTGGCAAKSTGEQQVDLSAWAGEVDTGQVSVQLSGLVGGFSNHDDSAIVEAFFLGADGSDLSAKGPDLVLAPATSTERGGKTGFVRRDATASLPRSTRTIRVLMTMTRVTGNSNDGYVDGLSLTATPDSRRPTAAVVRCNRGALPTSESQCTVDVADAGPPPRVAPTGQVNWKVTGGGSIARPARCTLQVSRAAPGISFCSVTYRPGPKGTPGGTEIPVRADYGGSEIHQPTGQRHRLLDARIVDPATGEKAPSDRECQAMADGMAAEATASVDRRYANPEVDTAGRPTGYQEGVVEAGARRTAYCIEYALTFVGKNGKAVLVGGTGLVWTGAWAAGGGALATVGEPGAGTIVGGSVAGALGWQLGGSAMVKASGEMFDSAATALHDPPDRRYKQPVRVRSVKRVRIRARGRSGRADARVLEPWLTELNRAGALAVALGKTIDKVGGAEKAGDAHWQGVQMRRAVTLARRLASSSDALARLGRPVARRARVSSAAKRRPSLRGFAKVRRQVASRGFTSKQKQRLRKAGFSAMQIEQMRLAARDRKLRNRDLVQAPSREIARAAGASAWRDYARFFRLWTHHPQVKEIAAQR